MTAVHRENVKRRSRGGCETAGFRDGLARTRKPKTRKTAGFRDWLARTWKQPVFEMDLQKLQKNQLPEGSGMEPASTGNNQLYNNTGGTGMSRIGRMPIAIPAGVTVEVAENNKVTVKGPKGTLERVLPGEMEIKVEGAEVHVSRPNDLKKMKSLHGLTRTLVNNMVTGVTKGFEKKLEVNGVGYRAAKAGKKLTLNLGYSHPVEMEDPEGIETVVEGQNVIIVKGIDKEKVGQFAAEIRDKRRPEPYKGKGIKYADEVIRRKVGKTGKK